MVGALYGEDRFFADFPLAISRPEFNHGFVGNKKPLADPCGQARGSGIHASPKSMNYRISRYQPARTIARKKAKEIW